MSKTLILTMGGTIDAEPYTTTPVNVTPLAQSIIPESLQKMGYAPEQFEVVSVANLDSKDVTPHHLKAAVSAMAEHADYEQIIITHGTDTMPEHARLLQGLMERWNIDANTKVIITGAMKPIANGPDTDGWKNLKFAMEHIENLSAGVHIVMHEQLLPIDGARKDIPNARIWIDEHAHDMIPVTPLQK